MAGSVNKVILIGNLGADPEVRNTQGGDKVANMRLACSESWKDKNTGEKRERTEWVSVVVWGALAGVVENYLAKGSKVYVEGSLQTRKWEDQNGNDRYSTEVVVKGFGGTICLIDRPQGNGEARGGGGEGGGPYQSEKREGRGNDGRRPRNKPAPSHDHEELDNDNIPF